MEDFSPVDSPDRFSSDDTERIAQYLAGELSDMDRADLEHWISAAPHRAHLVARIREEWETVPVRRPGRYNVSSALQIARVRMETPDMERRRTYSAGASVQPTRIGQHSRPGRFWWAGMTAVVMAVVAISSVYLVRHTDQKRMTADPDTRMTYSAPTGSVATVTLVDGSHATLAPGTTLRMTGRTVELVGEAIFDVAPDPAQPFLVRAGASVTRVLGTRFGVRKYEDDMEARVAVISGRVTLNNVLLNAGDIGRLPVDGMAVVQRNQDVAAELGWTLGRLVFRHAPLSEVAAQLTRWYGLDIVITDHTLAQYHVTTVIEGKSLSDDRLAMLEDVFDARITREGKRITIASRR